MRKGLKVLSTSLLLSTLLFAGCSCAKDDTVKNVSKMENHADALTKLESTPLDSLTVLDLYEALIASDMGNKAIADKITEFIGEEVLGIGKEYSGEGIDWNGKYENIISEKLKELAKSSAYVVKGEFSEEYMTMMLRADGYNIPTCTTYGTEDDLECDYTDYINKNFKVAAISTLLKEKYIYDVTLENTKDLFTKKQVRDVEYFTVSSSLENTYTDFSVRDFMRDLRNKIAANEVVDFEKEEAELKKQLVEFVTKQYNKIGTSDDASKTILADFSANFTQSIDTGWKQKEKTINDGEYSFSKVISSNSASSAVVSEQITKALLNAKDYESAIKNRKIYKVTDSSGADYYYLVNANASANIDAGDVLLSSTSDSSVYTYSIVRFRIIDSDVEDANDKYEAVKSLASESTLAKNALAYYLEENKSRISVYDDDIKEYLSTLYPDVFAE